jgi:putative hemolysin
MRERIASANKISFTYSTPRDSLAKRSVIRAIEAVGGQRRLARLYRRYVSAPAAYGDFFAAAVELLRLNVRYDASRLEAVPRNAPVLFIANHPYGVLDGLVLAWLASKARPDVKVLANHVLCQAAETRDHLLPVDFTRTEAALRTNVDSRMQAQRALRAGGAVGIFPAGAVAASEAPWRGPAVDVAWHPFAAKLVMMAKPTVVPVYFAGQNSRLFQLASHTSYTMRLSLFFWETARRMGSELEVAIGEPIPFADLAGYEDRTSLLRELRRRTYALASTFDQPPPRQPPFDREFAFPRHFKF